MATLFTLPLQVPVSSAGRPYAGAYAYFYGAGTTTHQIVYSDIDLTTAHAQPVVADAYGRFPAIYLNPSATADYRVQIKTSASVLIYDQDDIPKTEVTRTSVASALWPITAAETAAGITPSDYAYAPGDVRRYGAVGDGATDDTAAFVSAISALPLNTADVGVLSPKGFSNGGRIYVPRGRYKVTSKISLNRGVSILGEGREASQIVSFVDGDSVFQYTDAGRYLQDEIVVKDLSIWQDSSVVATAGAGIDLIAGSASIDSIAVYIDNVIIEGTYRGIRIEANVGGSVRNANINSCVSDGVQVAFNSLVSSTSLTFYNCYSHINGGHGFNIDHGAYVSFVGCASDSNTGAGYFAEDTHNISFLACGAEQNVNAIWLDSTFGAFINAYGIDNTSSAIKLVTTSNTSVFGGSYSGGTGYGIDNSANSTKINVVGTTWASQYSTTTFAQSAGVLNLEQSGALIGGNNENKWAIGNSLNPDATSTLNIGGTADSDTDAALKINQSFTGAGATRNSAAYVQAVTADSAVTYPLVKGVFVANPSKGAASTVTRSAGVYIQQQDKGATANANLMIDGTAGTVPAGDWSIYNDSTRPSMFKGPIQFTSLTAASAPNNSLFVDSADGVLKFKNSGGTSNALY